MRGMKGLDEEISTIFMKPTVLLAVHATLVARQRIDTPFALELTKQYQGEMRNRTT